MHVFRSHQTETATPVGWDRSVLLLSPEGTKGNSGQRLAALGGRLEVEAGLYDGLSMLIDDPRAADLLVIDCDAYGGWETGRRAFAWLGPVVERLPVFLISARCAEQKFPCGRSEPFHLRAPLTRISLHVALEQAFRGIVPAPAR
jgi:hypothetical protein